MFVVAIHERRCVDSAPTSLLRKAADKDDVADQVVTMCRTNTVTGQTLEIDSGRTFH